MRSLRSICVLGLERSGREAICSQIGKPFRHPHPRDPRRYLIDVERFPKSGGYVLTVYSDLSELKLDLPEREGLFVLRPRQIEKFLKEPLSG